MIYRNAFDLRSSNYLPYRFKQKEEVPVVKTLEAEMKYFVNVKKRLEKEVFGGGDATNKFVNRLRFQENEIDRTSGLQTLRKSYSKAIERSSNHTKYYSSNDGDRLRRGSEKLPNINNNNNNPQKLFLFGKTRISTDVKKSLSPRLRNLLKKNNSFINNDNNNSGSCSRSNMRMRDEKYKKPRRFSVPNNSLSFERRRENNNSNNISVPYPNLMNVRMYPFKRKSLLPLTLQSKMKIKKISIRNRKTKRKKNNNKFKKKKYKFKIFKNIGKINKLKYSKKTRKNKNKNKFIRKYGKNNNIYKKNDDIFLEDNDQMNKNIYGKVLVVYKHKKLSVFNNDLNEKIKRNLRK